MINFETVSEIFLSPLDNSGNFNAKGNRVESLIYQLYKMNKKIWDLEDSARMSELGDSHVAEMKRHIDINNQRRNDLITEIDVLFKEDLPESRKSEDCFCSESPAMVIDRLSIIFIKLSVVRKIILMIKEGDLLSDYIEKEKILTNQIDKIGSFLDLYFKRLVNGEVFFEIQQSVKIYNDIRVKEYIKKGLLS
jgi:hypothetical protein